MFESLSIMGCLPPFSTGDLDFAGPSTVGHGISPDFTRFPIRCHGSITNTHLEMKDYGMFIQLDDGKILTGKPYDQFDGKNSPWFPVQSFP